MGRGKEKLYFCGFRNAFAEYFDFDVTEGCMESDGHFSFSVPKQTLYHE